MTLTSPTARTSGSRSDEDPAPLALARAFEQRTISCRSSSSSSSGGPARGPRPPPRRAGWPGRARSAPGAGPSSRHAARPVATSSAAAASSASRRSLISAAAAPRPRPASGRTARGDEVGDFAQRRGGQSRRQRDHPVLDAAVLADQHRQRLPRASGTKLKLRAAARSWARPPRRRRPTGPTAPRWHWPALPRSAGRAPALDRRALAALGRCACMIPSTNSRAPSRSGPPGRGVRMGQQPALLQLLHHRADRGRRQVDRPLSAWTRSAARARDRPRPPGRRCPASGRQFGKRRGHGGM
jgi:hypothetical protein